MLEASSLLIGPWQREPGQPRRWQRTITDGATARQVGQVRWDGPAHAPWQRWLGGRRLDVLETEDAALLMALVRRWRLSPRWNVYDAEERRVGALQAWALLDSEGGRRGLTVEAGEGRGRIVDPSGRHLTDYAVASDRTTWLRFAPDLEANPFLRMLLLGAVVTQATLPGDA